MRNQISGIRQSAETSPGTHRRYCDSVGKFLDFLGPQADRSIEEVTHTQISAFRDAQLSRTAAATANTDLKVMCRIFRAARMDGYLLQDAAESVKAVRNRAPLERRPFTIDELRAIPRCRWRRMAKPHQVRTLYRSAARRSGFAHLVANRLEPRRNSPNHPQDRQALLIPIAAPLREHLLSLSGADHPRSPLHPRVYEILHAQHGRVGTLSNQFSELLVDAGLREPEPHRSKGRGRPGKRTGQELSFHSLRHTAVSLLMDARIPDAVVMALVGHESAAISQRYTHVGKEALSEAAKSLPEL